MLRPPRRRWLWAAVALAVLLGTSFPVGVQPGNGGVSSPSSAPTLVSNVLPVANSAGNGSDVVVARAYVPAAGIEPLGALPSSTPLSVEVGVALPHPSALQGLISALYTPGTPEFRAFESPSELAQKFGPSAETLSSAESYFEQFGLSVTPSPDHLLLQVSGPSGQVGKAFGTSFEQFRNPDGAVFFSHDSPAVLPPVVSWAGAYGLGNATPILPEAVDAPAREIAVTPDAGCVGATTELSPCQIWQAYDMTSLISGGTNGSTVRVAVVDPYSSAENQTALATDLNTFTTEYGLSVGAVNYVYPDRAPGNLNISTNTGWQLEDALDLEWARASAPGATIDMTFSPNSGSGLYEAIDWLVAHQAVNVISLSWGEPDVGVFNAFSSPCSVACNASTDGTYGLLAPVLAFAAAEGIGVFAASGDCGAADGTSGVSTNYPASDPDVTGVGGTVLTVNSSGTYLSEVGWSGNASGAVSPGCENQGGSGGGYAPFPRPVWQTGLPAGRTHRGVPDVALDAGTAVLVVVRGATAGVLGTSVATPIWAGIAAIADQFAGHPLGLLDPSLYSIASGTNYSNDFHDIVSGNNGYSATTGWDPVTGLGSPQVANLVVNLAHPVTVSGSTLATFVYASPRYGHAPLTVEFHVNATGGTGTYPLEGVSFGGNNASFAPGGSTNYTYDIPGVYSVQAYVVDSDANVSLSPPVAVVVGGGTALSVTLTASTVTPARDQVVQFSVKVVGGTAPYQYNYSFGDGTYAGGVSLATEDHAYGADGSFCAAVVVGDSAFPPDGAASARVAVGVGGAALPDCGNDTTPLTLSPAPGLGVRDAPADFPELFVASGGSTAESTLPPSIQYTTSDPYTSACGCTIFRAPGVYDVHGYANDSESEQANGTVDVTVAPPLVGSFVASSMSGPAPLTVNFSATATGGDGADPSDTVWTFGDGTGAVGASVNVTYRSPGEYIAVGHLSDQGHGNASEAFLIAVTPGDASGPSPLGSLVGTLSPAMDVPRGALVNLSAEVVSTSGSVLPAVLSWKIGTDSGAFLPSVNWTFDPTELLPNGTLAVTLGAYIVGGDGLVSVPIWLPAFGAEEPDGFVPATDALSFVDRGGPSAGEIPLTWNGTGAVSGPGTLTVEWASADEATEQSLSVQYSFPIGFHTVVATASDSWGDRATDVFSTAVTTGMVASASASTTSGAPPLTVTFTGNASGGVGPPYAYRWEFGDGGIAVTENASHTFDAVGTYHVALTVTDLLGDSVSLNRTVTVAKAPSGFPVLILLLGSSAVGVGAALLAATRRRRSAPAPASP